MIEISRLMLLAKAGFARSFFLLRILTATLWPERRSRAWKTFAKAPHPRSFPSSYLPNKALSPPATISISGMILEARDRLRDEDLINRRRKEDKISPENLKSPFDLRVNQIGTKQSCEHVMFFFFFGFVCLFTFYGIGNKNF